MARRRWIATTLVWVAACAVAAANVGVRTPQAAELLGGDPRLDVRPSETRTAEPPAPVLSALGTPTKPLTKAGLATKLDPLMKQGVAPGVVGATIMDADGTTWYSAGSGAKVPASTMKVLTSLVALDVLGADHRFATTVVQGAGSDVVLVGGGDPLLSLNASTATPGAARLDTLADATAASLKAAGKTSVTLVYDASLFTGPAWSPEWPETFKWSVAPMSALKVDAAHTKKVSERVYERHANPAQQAAEFFAAELKRNGIAVAAVKAGKAPAGASELAKAESPPLTDVVAHTLLYSDNDAAETLAWQVARARSKPASFDSARAVMTQELQRLGAWASGMKIMDGCGISANNLVAPEALAKAVRLGVTQPAVRGLALGLPVAGVSGTLAERFEESPALAGRGVVRAKTGTIRGVHTLAGYTVTADGQLVTFAFMVNGGGQDVSRRWLDQASAAVASCGC